MFQYLVTRPCTRGLSASLISRCVGDKLSAGRPSVQTVGYILYRLRTFSPSFIIDTLSISMIRPRHRTPKKLIASNAVSIRIMTWFQHYVHALMLCTLEARRCNDPVSSSDSGTGSAWSHSVTAKYIDAVKFQFVKLWRIALPFTIHGLLSPSV